MIRYFVFKLDISLFPYLSLPLDSTNPADGSLFPTTGLYCVFYCWNGLQNHCLRPLLLLPEEVEHLWLHHCHCEPDRVGCSQEGEPVSAANLPLGNVLSWQPGETSSTFRKAHPWEQILSFGDLSSQQTLPFLFLCGGGRAWLQWAGDLVLSTYSKWVHDFSSPGLGPSHGHSSAHLSNNSNNDNHRSYCFLSIDNVSGTVLPPWHNVVNLPSSVFSQCQLSVQIWRERTEWRENAQQSHHIHF